MKSSKFKQYSRIASIVGWSILFLIFFLEILEYLTITEGVLYSTCIILMLISAAYLHYYQLLPFFNEGKRSFYFLSTMLVIALISSLLYWVDWYFLFDESYSASFISIFIYYFLLTTIVVAVVSLYYFVDAWYHNIKRESQLRSEKLEAELNFLKSQINPHFLFNTLNNIYSFAQTGNPKTAPMLERLSSILRFMVYDCSEDRVELSKEVTAVEDLLEIHKMKNSKQKNIEYKVEGVKGFHLIAPLIIVNFVENACKHSDVISNPNGYIRIQITVDNLDQCILSISNSAKKKTKPNSPYQGLGLENIRKRLELQYGETFSMEEQLKVDQYHLKLNIPLERKQ